MHTLYIYVYEEPNPKGGILTELTLKILAVPKLNAFLNHAECF